MSRSRGRGSGSRRDAETALVRHATTKTRRREDSTKKNRSSGGLSKPAGCWRVFAFVLVLLVGGCRGGAPTTDERLKTNDQRPGTNDQGPATNDQPWFVDAAPQAGLSFTHFNGMSGEFYYPEIMPPGVALFDFDNDGDLDVLVIQGRMLGNRPISAATYPPADPSGPGVRLYRNDLAVGAGGARTLRFTDVTARSGIDAHGYSMGVAAGDYNNDGCIDIYVTALASGQLFRNNCDGTFTDVTRASRTGSSGWSVSAAFVDYDRDGWLDLFVGHYLNYRLEANIRCFGLAGGPDYCPPHAYTPQPSRLYHNNRDGTFSDVTADAGLAAEFGPALGVATADYNGDGWMDKIGRAHV